jgi:hypothetical protein
VRLSQGGAVTLAATLRNVTAAATGGDGDALVVGATGGGNNRIDAKNVIAFGTGADARTSTDGAATATVTLESSNFDTQEESGTGATVTDPGTGTNQTGAPLFVNAAIGDLHELAGSPTIDAGAVVDMMGTADLDGDPRTVGAAPDIGADEFVPAPASPPPSTPPSGLPSNSFTIGKLDGRRLTLILSSAGMVEITDAGARTSASRAFAAAKKKLLKPSSATGAPGTIQVKLRLTKAATRKLRESGRVKMRARITFTPNGGTANTQTARLKVKRARSSASAVA